MGKEHQSPDTRYRSMEPFFQGKDDGWLEGEMSNARLFRMCVGTALLNGDWMGVEEEGERGGFFFLERRVKGKMRMKMKMKFEVENGW